MSYKLALFATLILYVGLTFFLPKGDSHEIGDTSLSNVIRLGNIPVEKNMQGKARNIWDMTIFDNKLYIGYGSTTTNAGPIQLYSYHLDSTRWNNEILLATEAVERFRIIDSTLYIPCSDPTKGDQLKYWTNNTNGWQEHANDHEMAHVRDVYFYRNQLYLFGNTRCPSKNSNNCAGMIAIDDKSGKIENGLLSKVLSQAKGINNARWNWFFGVMEYKQRLLVPNAMFTQTSHPDMLIKDNAFFLIDSTGVYWSAYADQDELIQNQYFYPKDTLDKDYEGTRISLRPFESIEMNQKLIYTLRTYSMNASLYQSAYNNSAGLFLKDSLYGWPVELRFGPMNAIGEDLLIIHDEIYVLASHKIDQDNFIIYIFKSSDPSPNSSVWEEVIQIKASNMGRSFEHFRDRFYIGLGHNAQDEVHDSGQILEVYK